LPAALRRGIGRRGKTTSLRLADLHHRRMVLAMAGETGEPTDEVRGGPGVGQGGSKLPNLLLPVWMISPADHGRAGLSVRA